MTALTPTKHTDLWWPYGSVTGRYTFTCSGADSGGRLAQMLVVETRGAAVPLHVHRDTDETFLVLSGTLVAVVGDEEIEAGPGDYVFGPAGVPHAWIVTSERAELFVTVAGAGTLGPAGYGIEGFFKEVATPVVEGEPPPAPCLPDPQHFAERMAVYGIDLLGPPPAAR